MAFNYSSYESMYCSEMPSETLTQQIINELKEDKEKEEQKLRNSFLKSFPTLDFDKLVKQNSSIRTNDGSVHYKYDDTNDYYSYSSLFGEERWYRPSYSNGFLESLFV